MPLDDMMFGLSNYTPRTGGGEMIQPQIEDKEDLLSPGQPVKKKGFDWKKLAGIGIAAPVVAALVSRMSGPRGGISFGDALGSLGAGFVQGKLEQIKQRRQLEFQEKERMLDLAHKAVMDLKNLSAETLQAFPKLQQLSEKYQEAILNDGKLSDSEAAEIVRLNTLAREDSASAGLQQESNLRQRQIEQDFQTKDRLQRDADVRELQTALGGGSLDAPEEGVGAEDLRGLAGEMLRDQRLAQMERETPQEFVLNGQRMTGTPSERIRAQSEAWDRDHQKEMERIRQRGQGGIQGRQERIEAYRAAMAQLETAKQAVLQMADEDPEMKAQMLRDILAQQQRIQDNFRMGGMSLQSFDQAGLGQLLDKYQVPGGQPSPLVPTPPSPGQGRVGKYSFSPVTQ